MEPKNLGGHENFHLYKSLFHSLYQDPLRPIFDILGRRIDFRPESIADVGYVDNAAHVCYGGRRHQWYAENYFDVQRAERIEWIEEALSHPSKIRRDREFYTNEKYLLRIPRNGEPMEYFCVIAENMGKNVAGIKTMEFITAYPIDWLTYERYVRVEPFVYPEGVTNYSSKKRGKKKKD